MVKRTAQVEQESIRHFGSDPRAGGRRGSVRLYIITCYLSSLLERESLHFAICGCYRGQRCFVLINPATLYLLCYDCFPFADHPKQ